MKYLFKAYFENGKILEQSPADVSAIDPQRSSFYDILCEEQIIIRPVKFELHGDGKIYTVDLTNGSFSINGVIFSVYPDEVTDLKLIYFRRHILNLSGPHCVSSGISFHFGWQVRGTNIERTVIIE